MGERTAQDRVVIAPLKGVDAVLTLHRTADFQEAGPVQAVRQNRRVSYPVWGQTLACYALVVSPLSRRIHSVSLAGSRRFFRRVYSWVHRCYVRCVAGFTRSPLQCCNGVAASPSTVNRIGVSPFPFAFALLKPHTARLAQRRTEMSKNANPP